MEEPNRIERMVGEIVGLRVLVATLLEKQGGADAVREALLEGVDAYDIRSDTEDGAERIRACAKSMLQNFPEVMDEKIVD